jgi:O-antigen/teichoic acid export membrane protein
MRREFLGDLGKYLPSYIVPAVVGLVAIPIITRLFPPGDYGDYALVMVSVSVATGIGSGWISASVIRFFSACQRENRLGEFYGTTIKLALISIATILIVGLGILLIVKSHISANLYFLMLIGLLSFAIISFYSVIHSILRAKRKATWYSFFIIWRSVVGLGLGVALVVCFHLSVEGLLWGAVVSIALAFPLAWKVALGKPSLREGGVRSSLASEMTRYGLPLIVVNLSSWVAMLSDRYVIDFFRGSAEVGIYSAAYAIPTGSIVAIVSLFALSATPIGVNIWEKEGIKKSQEFLTKTTRYYLLIGLPAAVGLSVLAKPIMDIFTAPAYFSGYSVIPLVAFASFLLGVSGRFAMVLNFYKKTNLNMICTLVSAALNLGLNIIFIPKYGFIAAAVTTLIAFAVDLILKIIVSWRLLAWQFPFQSLGRVLAASAVMGAVVYFVANSLTSSTLINLILGIVIGVAVYAIMLLLLREPQPEELQELRAVGRKILRRR